VKHQRSNTHLKILILEDDRDTLEEVNETLTDEGFITLQRSGSTIAFVSDKRDIKKVYRTGTL
jgi:DNA-binding response OmpR family regulator